MAAPVSLSRLLCFAFRRECSEKLLVVVVPFLIRKQQLSIRVDQLKVLERDFPIILDSRQHVFLYAYQGHAHEIVIKPLLLRGYALTDNRAGRPKAVSILRDQFG